MKLDRRFYRWGEERRYGKFSHIIRTALLFTVVLLSARLTSLFMYAPAPTIEAFFLSFPAQILMISTISVVAGTLGWYVKEAR